MATIPYKIFTKQKLFSELYEKRERQKKNNHFIAFFDFGRLKFAVIYEPKFTSYGYGHFGFHAMSKGLEEITDTGYRSEFVHHKTMGSYEEIKDYWIDYCSRKGINLDNPSPYQGSLFE